MTDQLAIKFVNRRKSHASKIETSERLQRLRNYLADKQWHTTLEIATAVRVCAVNSIIHELRCNGLQIECKRNKSGHYEYRMEG